MPNPTVLIIAGGTNSRFFPLNSSLHKGDFTLGGQSFLARTLHNLADNGFHQIVMVVTPQDNEKKYTQTIVENTQLSLQINYVVQEKATGMGNAVLAAKDFLAETFAVIYPYHTHAGEVLTRMQQTRSSEVLYLTETDQPWEFGIVSIKDEKAVAIIEKPARGTEPSNLKVQGIYLLSQDFVDILQQLPNEQYNYEKALNQLLQQKQGVGYIVDRPLPSLKYAWDLFTFQKDLFSQMKSYRDPSAEISDTAVIDETQGPVVIEAGAVISHAVRLVGPCYIGKNVHIGDFSLIRGSTLEENVKVGGFAEVARSIFLTASTMHTGYVGDSIIGSKTKIGGGFMTANKRMDRQNIQVEINGKMVETKTNHLGVMIGEETSIGVNANVMPGKCIGARSIIYPGITIWSNVPANSSLKQMHEVHIQQRDLPEEKN